MRKLRNNQITLNATDLFKHSGPAKAAINYAIACADAGIKSSCVTCRINFELNRKALCDALEHISDYEDRFSVSVVEKQ